MTPTERVQMQARIALLTTEVLESELPVLMRRRAFTAREVAIAEEFLARAERHHEEAELAHDEAFTVLNERYASAANHVGAPVPEPAAVLTLDEELA